TEGGEKKAKELVEKISKCLENGNASHIYSFDVPSRKLDVQIYIDEGKNESDDDFAINVRHEQPSKHVEEVSPWILESSGLGIIEDCGGIGGLERIQELLRMAYALGACNLRLPCMNGMQVSLWTSIPT
ncbi:MAG: hypothetical protein MJZ50_06840, partial [Treponema sp.]|nr:hypothetical protein [Treponema sp.]